ncbi:tetratricopeptide repeat protein [Colwellia piezophila]|uniref:tetratricopeptide repeat protein n=1 Tax=Colwellia piezophila TaxID=211668 RepID=UPI00036C6CF3|nr:hypothetical protein [Colwellia piezophila]
MNFKKLLLILLLLSIVGCSLSSASVRIAHQLYIDGEHQDSLVKIEGALVQYKGEYSDDDKSSLLFLKAQNYSKLKQYNHAISTWLYIMDRYPDTEAAYRAKPHVALYQKAMKNVEKRERKKKTESNNTI